jgi:hypothetical protein
MGMTEYIEVSLTGVGLNQRRLMQAWCCEVLGMDKNDMSDLPVIYFATEQDASMFCLRWA